MVRWRQHRRLVAVDRIKAEEVLHLGRDRSGGEAEGVEGGTAGGFSNLAAAAGEDQRRGRGRGGRHALAMTSTGGATGSGSQISSARHALHAASPVPPSSFPRNPSPHPAPPPSHPSPPSSLLHNPPPLILHLLPLTLPTPPSPLSSPPSPSLLTPHTPHLPPHSCMHRLNMATGPHRATCLSRPYTDSSSYVHPMSTSSV